MPSLLLPLRRAIPVCGVAAAGLTLGACSAEQIGDALANLCHGADNCTTYNADGSPVEGRWSARY